MYEVIHANEDFYKVGTYGSERRLIFNHDIGKAVAKEYRRVAYSRDACCVEYTVWRRPMPVAPVGSLVYVNTSLEYAGEWPKKRPVECNPGMNEMMRHYWGPTVNESE
jgi:hypothetical protein